MRRFDKKIAMKKANILFEQRCNENKFSWNGQYANEEDLKESDEDEDKENYHFPYNVSDKENDKDLFLSDGTISLGDDLEVVEEADCDCNLDESGDLDPTDVEKTQWFSQVDGERLVDKIFN